MRQNDGIPGDSRFLGQPAATLENRALHQLSGHYPAWFQLLTVNMLLSNYFSAIFWDHEQQLAIIDVPSRGHIKLCPREGTLLFKNRG